MSLHGSGPRCFWCCLSPGPWPHSQVPSTQQNMTKSLEMQKAQAKGLTWLKWKYLLQWPWTLRHNTSALTQLIQYQQMPIPTSSPLSRIPPYKSGRIGYCVFKTAGWERRIPEDCLQLSYWLSGPYSSCWISLPSLSTWGAAQSSCNLLWHILLILPFLNINRGGVDWGG